MREQQGLTGNGLKLIAIFTMLIDHIGFVILERGVPNLNISTESMAFWNNMDTCFRALGRIAFIIFLFLLVEGFKHTSNVWKYALRMLIFAIVSEIPFNIAVSGKVINPEYQSVYVTLLLSLLMMIAFEAVSEHLTSKVASVAVDIAIFVIVSAAAYFLKCDYTTLGIAMAATMYFCRNRSDYGVWIMLAVIVLYTVLPWFLVISGLIPYSVFMITGGSSPIEALGVVAFFFIRKYNGERGSFSLKYVFYIFYPAHLLILGLITAFILNGGFSLY
ncbi:MAG: conjugal transfer protein TraX [Lachnospiraceae bacterium]|nr:conjugal transfer protein TraX [Lachnospiraceae bacterium]